MSILLIARQRDMRLYKDEMLKCDPNVEVEVWPDVKHKDRVTMAVAWKHPEGVLGGFKNLRAVSSLGAGVEHLLRDSSIPEGVVLTRVVPPSLISDMSDYLISALLNIVRNTYKFAENQRKGVWEPILAMPKRELTVGVMGLGEIGRQCAVDIAAAGFPVTGWSRSKRDIEGVETFSAGEMDAFLGRTNVLVSLLPLTESTRDLMDLGVFKRLKKPSYVMNVGRGLQLVDEDLIYALHAGVVEGAVLDVFREEPLPESHPFWSNRRVVVTPHIASVSDPAETAVMLLDHYKRLMSGMEPSVVVDAARGY